MRVAPQGSLTRRSRRCPARHFRGTPPAAADCSVRESTELARLDKKNSRGESFPRTVRSSWRTVRPAQGGPVMAERVLRGSRLGAVSYETDRNAELAPRQVIEFACPAATGSPSRSPTRPRSRARGTARSAESRRCWSTASCRSRRRSSLPAPTGTCCSSAAPCRTSKRSWPSGCRCSTTVRVSRAPELVSCPSRHTGRPHGPRSPEGRSAGFVVSWARTGLAPAGHADGAGPAAHSPPQPAGPAAG